MNMQHNFDPARLESRNWKLRTLVGCSLSVTMLAVGCGPAHAVEADGQHSPTVAPQPATAALQEVVVTAQRRSESLQNVPIAISVASGANLEKAGVTGTLDLQTVTPGLITTEAGTALLPYIRGVGSNQAGVGADSSVATYIDGVYIAYKAANVLELNNIDRIEVLKGPQGTLFGRNATGGAISIITKDPSNEFDADAQATYGSYNTADIQAYISMPIDDNLAINVAGLASRSDGYIKNIITGKMQGALISNAITTTLAWKPLSNLTFKAMLLHDYLSDNADQVDHFASGTTPKNTVGTIYTNGNFETAGSYNPPAWVNANLGRVEADYDFQNMRLSSISAYQWGSDYSGADGDATSSNFQYQSEAGHESVFSQEVHLLSQGSGRLQWITGLYYIYDDEWQNPLNVLSNLPWQPTATNLATPGASWIQFRPYLLARSIAGFAQVTYKIMSNNHITGGIRYTDETKTINNTLTEIVSGPGGLIVPSLVGRGAGAKTIDLPTWRLALDHEFNKDVMAYISYNRGFKSGNFSTTSVGPQVPVKPEILDAYEFGVKSEILDRRLRVNAAAFYYNYQDMQVAVAQGALTVTENAAQSTLYGLDLDLAYRPQVVPVTLRAGLSLLHTRFGQYDNASVYVQNPAATGGALAEKINATGEGLPYAPTATATLGEDYNIDLKGGGRVTFTADGYYNSGFDAQPYVADGGEGGRIHGYATLNSSLAWSSGDRSLVVRLWGKNITDTAYPLFVVPNAFGFRRSDAAPATFGVTVSKNFGK